MSLDRKWQQVVLPLLSRDLSGPLERLQDPVWEIRLRLERPLCVVGPCGPVLLDSRRGAPQRVTRGHLDAAVERMCHGSVYAREQEFSQGFLTLPGGHRVGMVGRAVAPAAGVRLFPDSVTSLNIRLARQVPGAASTLIQRLGGAGSVGSILIFSPPGAGKTTILRDLIRQLAHRRQVAVVDERGELAGSDGSGPQLDLGPMADILEFCPKATGIMWVIRSMGPQVVATDEVGSREDLEAVEEATRSGVAVLATCHGGSAREVAARPGLEGLLKRGCFDHLVGLGFSRGAGTVESIVRAEEVVGRAASGGLSGNNGRHLSGSVSGRTSPAAGEGS